MQRGSEVLVQVIKEGIGNKGPTLSTYISIPGRYLVLMPGLQRVGVSRKIADEKTRRELRRIMKGLRPPEGVGFIIRTAGVDRDEEDLKRDLNYLLRLWETIVRRLRRSRRLRPTIYEESDMMIRTIRDIYTGEIDSVLIDSKTALRAGTRIHEIVMPQHVEPDSAITDGAEPIFNQLRHRRRNRPHSGSSRPAGRWRVAGH